MSLVIPAEYAKDINKHSGFLSTRSVWAGKTLKGLWRSPVNVDYLTKQLLTLISHPQYVHDHSSIATSIGLDISLEEQSNYVADGVKRGFERPHFTGDKKAQPFRKKHTKPTLKSFELAKQFGKFSRSIADAVPAMVEEYVLPYNEDLKTHNPIMELHYINLDFLTSTSETIIQNPTSFLPNFNNWNDDLGTLDKDPKDYEYSAESWNDGTWHPEHLFTQSKANRSISYWDDSKKEIWNAPIGYPGMNEEEAAIKRADMLSAQAVTFSNENVDGQYLPENFEDAAGVWGFSRAKIPFEYEKPNYQNGYTNESVGGRGPGNQYKHLALPDLELLGGSGFSNTKTPNERRRGDDRGLYSNTLNSSLPFQGKPAASAASFSDKDVDIKSGRRGRFANGGQFPFWQTTMHQRAYDRDNSEGLAEGGRGDRREQTTRGYDMSTLTNRSSTKKNRIPPNPKTNRK